MTLPPSLTLPSSLTLPPSLTHPPSLTLPSLLPHSFTSFLFEGYPGGLRLGPCVSMSCLDWRLFIYLLVLEAALAPRTSQFLVAEAVVLISRMP